jgi:hypothetical protein
MAEEEKEVVTYRKIDPVFLTTEALIPFGDPRSVNPIMIFLNGGKTILGHVEEMNLMDTDSKLVCVHLPFILYRDPGNNKYSWKPLTAPHVTKEGKLEEVRLFSYDICLYNINSLSSSIHKDELLFWVNEYNSFVGEFISS